MSRGGRKSLRGSQVDFAPVEHFPSEPYATGDSEPPHTNPIIYSPILIVVTLCFVLIYALLQIGPY